MDKESELQEEVESLALSLKATVAQLNDLRRDLETSHHELRSDLEAARQANSEISKHNQELSKDNERLRGIVKELEHNLDEAQSLIDGGVWPQR